MSESKEESNRHVGFSLHGTSDETVQHPDYLSAMHPELDAFTINFSEDQMRLMNYCLAFLMFGVALDMKISDFRRVAQFPKSVLVGLASQWLILPILTVYLIHIWDPIPSIALGLLLVSACPGGNLSNYATHLSKGNAALSVTLTSFVTVSSILATPLVFAGLSMFVPQTRELMERISLSPWQMLSILVKLVLIPLVAGMLVNYYFPAVTQKIRKPVSRVSLLIFIAFIIFALFGEIDNIFRYLHYVLLLVIVHNLMAMGAGYFWAKWHRLPEADARAISMETGIQNSGLGMVLIFTFFPALGGMMLVTAFWAVWDLVSSFIIAMYWSRNDPGRRKAAKRI
jgi:BASS family bile acid:Na+ symporter